MRIENSNVYQPVVGKAPENAAEPEKLPQAAELSPAQKQLSKQEALQKKMEEGQALLASLYQQLQASNEQAEKADEAAEKQLKCYKIAENIVSGDRVPASDMQYLMKNDPGLFSRSIMLRMVKENPQKLKRVTEDDDLDIVPDFGAYASAPDEQKYSIFSEDFGQQTLGALLDTKT